MEGWNFSAGLRRESLNHANYGHAQCSTENEDELEKSKSGTATATATTVAAVTMQQFISIPQSTISREAKCPLDIAQKFVLD